MTAVEIELAYTKAVVLEQQEDIERLLKLLKTSIETGKEFAAQLEEAVKVATDSQALLDKVLNMHPLGRRTK